MPRSATPVGRSKTPTQQTLSGNNGLLRELNELRTTVKHQGGLIEKQGALLLGHAQLLHEMREEILTLRSVGGAGHERQLKDLTTNTLRGLSSSIEVLQKDAARIEKNTQLLANHQGITLTPAATDESINATTITKNDDTHMADLTLGSLDLDLTQPSQPIVQMSEFEPIEEVAPKHLFASKASIQRTQSPRGGSRPITATSTSNNSGRDLYSRGMAQKKKRDSEIANRKKVEEEEDRRAMRKPEISSLAKRSKSSDKPLAMRTDEWRAKREKRREHLRTEMQKLEEESLQPAPQLNPRSVKIATAAEEKKKSVTHQTHETGSGYAAHPLGNVSPKSPVPQQTPISMIASPADSSPPPLDELLERLRKRRELLGLTSSDSPL